MLFLHSPAKSVSYLRSVTKHCHHKLAMVPFRLIKMRRGLSAMANEIENITSRNSNDSGNRLVWIIVGTVAGLVGLGISTYNSKLDRIETALHSLTVDITKDISNVKAKVDQLDKLADGTVKEQMARTAKFGELEAQLKILTLNQNFTDTQLKSLAENLAEFRKEMRNSKSNANY